MFGLEKLGSLGQGANDAPAILSKEEIDRRRKVAQALMQQATDTSPVQHWTQGAARLAQALDASIGDYQANKADREAQAEGRKLSEGLFGSGATASLPQQTMTSGVAPPSAPSPTPVDGDTSAAFLDTLKGNGITNPHALAAVGATGYHESRWSPGNLNRTWSDPSESGQAGTAGGALSWRGPRLQALQAFAASQGEQGNGSAATQAKFFAQEDPQLIQRLNAAKTPEEAMGLMNNAWRYAGYDKPDGETAARMASVRQWSSRVAPMGAGDLSRATPDAAPGAPVQVAQAGPGMPQTAAPQVNGAPSLAKLLAIQNSPAFDRMPAGSQAVVKALIAKQVGQETKDPLDQEQKRLNIQKLQTELANSGLSKREQELRIKKAERDLEGEGAVPLTPEERAQYGITAEQPAYKDRNGAIKFGPAASKTQVAIDQRQESEFGKETGKALAKRFDEMATQGDDAAQNLALVDELRRLGGRIDTGGGATVKAFLGKIGIKTDGVSDIEAFNSLIDRMTPAQRLPGSGATSDFDAKMFKGSLPSLMATPDGNKLIIDTIEKIAQNRMARGDIAMRVQIGELTPKDGLAEIRKLQAEAKATSDAVKNFGKPKEGATPAQAAPQAQTPKRAPAADPLGLFQ